MIESPFSFMENTVKLLLLASALALAACTPDGPIDPAVTNNTVTSVVVHEPDTNQGCTATLADTEEPCETETLPKAYQDPEVTGVSWKDVYDACMNEKDPDPADESKLEATKEHCDAVANDQTGVNS